MILQYGASTRYLAGNGRAYFAWQSGLSGMAGLVARKFAPAIRPHDTVVDFGCGGGFILSALTCGRRIGVDLNPAARQAVLARGIECFGDLAELPDGVADVVISHHALEHVPYPVRALEMMRHKLAAGGKLLLCVPLDDWRAQKRFRETDIHRHLHTWTPQLLGNTLAEAGFPVKSADIRILHRAVHPLLLGLLKRMPRPVCNLLLAITAVALKRRELFAAVPKCR